MASPGFFYEMGIDFLKNFDPASIKLHSKSLMCPLQFKSIHPRVREGHVALLNTFFLLFMLQLPKFLQLCNFFLFSLLFSKCSQYSLNYLLGLKILIPKSECFWKQNNWLGKMQQIINFFFTTNHASGKGLGY